MPEEKPWYIVLVRDGLARVVAEGEHFKLADSGWEVVWDSAHSEKIGYARAREMHGAEPADSYLPLRMREPKVLYRSVSVPEIADIAARGVILGAGSAFNPFDPRRLVFFGDTPSRNLLAQGEEVERMISTKLSGRAIHRDFDLLQKEIEDARRAIEEALDADLKKFNQRRIREGLSPLDVKNDEVRAHHRSWINGALLDRRARLEWRERTLRERYGRLFDAAVAEEYERRKTAPITHALIQTVPLSGGLHYSMRHGSSGMAEEDEYGFRPGGVGMSDVVSIAFYKNTEVVSVVAPDALRVELRKIGVRVPVRPSHGPDSANVETAQHAAEKDMPNAEEMEPGP